MAEGNVARKAGDNAGHFKPGDGRINRTKPGPGRPTDQARAEWAELAKQGRATLRKAKVLDRDDHPLFAFALKESADRGEGRPAQSVDLTSGGEPIQQSVILFGGLVVEF